MKLGPYSATPEAAVSLVLSYIDALRVNLTGVPRLPGKTPKEIAVSVLQYNAQGVLHTGQGHFWFMRPSDFGMSIRGMFGALPLPYIRSMITRMITESARLGEVPTCFRAVGGFHGFTMPYARADGLPWLLHAIHEYRRFTGSSDLSHEYHDQLQALVDTWEATQLEAGLVASHVRGDWMDTVRRPSSTYNNVCALHMFTLLPRLGLKSQTKPQTFEKALLRSRLKKTYLIDYADTDRESIDAAVYALYLEVLPKTIRGLLADRLMAGDFAEPYPIRAATSRYKRRLVSPVARVVTEYHNSVRLHLGFMYLNGLNQLGRDVTRHQQQLEELVLQYGNFVEALNPKGKLYRTWYFASEYGLTMAAGQYLELNNRPKTKQ